MKHLLGLIALISLSFLTSKVTVFAQTGKKMGEPVKNSVIQNGLIKQINNKKYFFTVLVGTPAKILQYDLLTGSLIKETSIPGTNNSWGIIESNNIIYIAGINGVLYAYNNISGKVTSLGKPISSESVIFTLTKDKVGNVYGGTYPNSGVFKYNPKSGFNILNGKTLKGNKYVRSISYYNNTLFLGLGTTADLLQYDLSRNSLLSKSISNEFLQYEFIYDQKLVEWNNVPTVIGTLSKNAERKAFLYNLQKQTVAIEDSFDVSSAIVGGANLYYGKNGYLVERYSNGREVQLKKTGSSVIFSDKIGNDLYFITKNKSVYKYNVNSKSISTYQLVEKSASIKINYGFIDDNQNVWTSGYLAGGIAKVSESGQVLNFNGLDQAESMVLNNNKLYIGVYPQSKIYVFDTRKPWKVNENPKLLSTIKGQDRPASVAIGPENNSIYFGTIPTYGKTGGSLIEIRENNSEPLVYQNLIPSQSIISLLPFANKLYGGTSVSGGLGSKQVAKESKLFIWDVQLRKILWQNTLIKGSKSISGLSIFDSSTICGMNDNYFFLFNTIENKLIRTIKVIDDKEFKNPMRGSTVVVKSKSEILVSINNNLYQVNPTNGQTKLIKNNVEKIFGKGNQIYYTSSSSLFKY